MSSYPADFRVPGEQIMAEYTHSHGSIDSKHPHRGSGLCAFEDSGSYLYDGRDYGLAGHRHRHDDSHGRPLWLLSEPARLSGPCGGDTHDSGGSLADSAPS